MNQNSNTTHLFNPSKVVKSSIPKCHNENENTFIACSIIPPHSILVLIYILIFILSNAPLFHYFSNYNN